jgi:hypothetical protein
MAADPRPSRALREPDDDEDEDDLDEHKTDAFERQYLDDRSWENLVEDEQGRLVATQATVVQRRKLRSDRVTSRVRRGMIRYGLL